MLKTLTAAYREAFSLPRSVRLISTATLVNQSGTMVVPFLALFLTENRCFSKIDLGLTIAIYGVGGVAGSYLGGWLTDRLRRPHRVMEASLVLTGLAFVALGHVEARWSILGIMAALGFATKTFSPARTAALALQVGPLDRRRASALNRLAENVGLTLGAGLGGFLAVRDYSWLFRVDSATCALAALFLWFSFRRETLVDMPRTPEGEGVGKYPWRDKPFLAFLVLRFLLACVTVQLAITFPLTLREHYGFSESQFGLVMATNTLIVVLFEMVLVHSLSKKNPLRLIAVGSFLLCLGFGLLPFGGSFTYVAFTVMVWSVGEMLTLPVLDSVTANRAEETSRGRYMGMANSVFTVAGVVAPIGGIWVYKDFGAISLWTGCISIGILLLVGFWVLGKTLTPDSTTSGKGTTEPMKLLTT